MDRIRALPKAELHVHLDGSLRPETMVELAEEDGVALPHHDVEALARYMVADGVSDLVEYLARFETTLSVMQTERALERFTYEMVLDHAAEGVWWLEIRFSPILNTRGGLTMEQVMEAVLSGFRRGSAETEVQGGLILCGIRNMDPSTSLAISDVAVEYRDRGVLAFDLAGAESGHPASRHQAAFDRAALGNLPITIHAGEAFGPPSIQDALHRSRAARLGHGTRLKEDPGLERWVRDRRIPLEICLTSNVQTRVAPTFEEHPVRRYFDQGILLSLCTDNTLVSGTTLTTEYARAARHLGFSWEELVKVARMGFEAAFLPWDEKQAILERFDGAVARLEPAPDLSASRNR